MSYIIAAIHFTYISIHKNIYVLSIYDRYMCQNDCIYFWHYYFELLDVTSIKIRKMKVFSLPALNSSLIFFLILYRSEFLFYIILLLWRTSFHISCMAGILATNFLNFFFVRECIYSFFTFEGQIPRTQNCRLLGFFSLNILSILL